MSARTPKRRAGVLILAASALVCAPLGAALADDPIRSTVRRMEVPRSGIEALLAPCDPAKPLEDRLAPLRDDLRLAVNAERYSVGLSILGSDSLLTRAAQTHAEDMAAGHFVSHQGSDGSSVADRVERAGYDYRVVAENIARGQPDVTTVVADWMESPGHRGAILHREVTNIGVGFATAPHKQEPGGVVVPGCYWVMVVGAAQAAY